MTNTKHNNFNIAGHVSEFNNDTKKRKKAINIKLKHANIKPQISTTSLVFYDMRKFS